MSNAEKVPYVELKNIVKVYGGVIKALDGIDFKIEEQEIIGLLGDNGAGKSTLIKILSGVLQPTSGEIYIDGKKTVLSSSKVAMDAGIETIYQDMNLIDSMNITRNIFCGRELKNRAGFMHLKEMEKQAMDLLEREVTIEGIQNPDQLVGRLSGGQKQSVSIARAMFFKNRILLLDEPTSALSVRETQAFLDHIRRLRDEGFSVVLVTHNMYHAHQVSDRFFLISHGRCLLDMPKEKTSLDEITDIVCTQTAAYEEKTKNACAEGIQYE